MKYYIECLPCFVDQAVRCASIVTEDNDLRNEILKGVLRELSKVGIERSPPEVAPLIYRVIEDLTGCDDPYIELKRRSNRIAKKMYPKFKRIVEDSEDKVTTALKLAIAGNIIDFGAASSFDVNGTIDRVLRSDLKADELKKFLERLESSKHVLYMADNAGEIFFDRLFLEELSKLDGVNLKFAVKERPILNDVLLDDAAFAGIAEFAEVVTTGAGSPGEGLRYCSEAFVDAFKSSDLVISKGQGNFESIAGHIRDNHVFFLFIVKCPVIARITGSEVGSVVFKNFGGDTYPASKDG
jgi:hypothetical protein